MPCARKEHRPAGERGGPRGSRQSWRRRRQARPASPTTAMHPCSDTSIPSCPADESWGHVRHHPVHASCRSQESWPRPSRPHPINSQGLIGAARWAVFRRDAKAPAKSRLCLSGCFSCRDPPPPLAMAILRHPPQALGGDQVLYRRRGSQDMCSAAEKRFDGRSHRRIIHGRQAQTHRIFL